VLDYFVGAYDQWADQGADAFRIDTISHMSTTFWKQFAARIRAKHPGFFMFGEAFDYSPDNIGQYTWPSSGSISVLDSTGISSASVLGRTGVVGLVALEHGRRRPLHLLRLREELRTCAGTVLGGVGGQLHAIDGEHVPADQSFAIKQGEHLGKHRRDRLARAADEVRDRGEMRLGVAGQRAAPAGPRATAADSCRCAGSAPCQSLLFTSCY
jgi:hypothetical protein